MRFSDIVLALKQGAVLLTINQRLARHLLNKVEQTYLNEGVLSWVSPTIVSLDAWLLQQWQARFDTVSSSDNGPLTHKTLLTPEQCLVLWERVINESADAELMNVSATAKAASKARQLGVQWLIGQGPSFELSDNADHAAFDRWHRAFKHALVRGQWIDRVQLSDAVCSLLTNEQLSCPNQFVLAGFDVLTPSQKTLIDTLNERGADVLKFEPTDIKGTAYVVSTTDVAEEMNVMAQWARERLEETPNASIGIVVPELETVRQPLERAFKAAFYPGAAYGVDVPFDKPYNVSLGLPLPHYAPVKQVLRLLQFFSSPLPLNELSLLLRSSFISAGQAEWGNRGQLEVVLRKRTHLTYSIKQLRNAAQATDDELPLCPQLLLSLNETVELLEKSPNRVLPSEWVGVIRRLLTAMGVQGDRELSSTEYQVFQAWDGALQNFATLDVVHGVINYSAALSALRRLISERVFQPETPDAPIQILGLMESAGHQFDALWVCGLHDGCWPPAPQPSPFLSINEQRKQGLLQSSAELQYQHAKAVTRQWVQSATSVVLSYSTANGDTPQVMSPLLEELPVATKEQVLNVLPINRLAQRVGTGVLIKLEDICGPIVQKDGITRGGVGVLKDQSACPFKAYAHYRLQARAMEEPEPGIDQRLRGSLVHRCLEKIWNEIQTHEVLCDMSQEQRTTLVQGVVSKVIERESYRTPILKTTFGKLESTRMAGLLMDWLTVDSEREPFSVQNTELKQTLSIGDLELNTVIDRVDTLADGSTAIIDYKTGETGVKSWFGERPEEPQLPLYSVFGNHTSAAVSSMSFAQLKKGKLKYVGLSERAEHFSALKELDDPKVKSDEADWTAQMAHWKTVMTGLSNDFVAGDAQVNPMDKACQYCDLTSLCRINEMNTEGASNE
jgi:ATP-dependent helicase/nuclease subunit B